MKYLVIPILQEFNLFEERMELNVFIKKNVIPHFDRNLPRSLPRITDPLYTCTKDGCFVTLQDITIGHRGV